MTRPVHALTPAQRASLSRVVVVGNAKGGVAKTTTAVHLAALTAVSEVDALRVLLIDLDPQGSCGHSLIAGWPNGGEGRISDQGEALARTLVFGDPLKVVIPEVRPRVDLICGGPHLKTVGDTLVGGLSRGERVHLRLAVALSAIASQYDLIVIDTPPGDHHLLQLALQAARWLFIPTKSDRASIDGLNLITSEFQTAADINETLELLGVVLVATGTAATTVRRNAIADIEAVFGGEAPVLEGSTRLAEAAVNEISRRGMLAHEIAVADGDDPPWKALKEGRKVRRTVGSMGGLADDYTLMVDEVLKRIGEAEQEAVEAGDLEVAR